MEHLDIFQNSADEPKHTKAAAYITNIYQDRLLVLWRNKWEDEGTPLILPGGGCLKGESLKACAIREAKEEIGLDLMESNLSSSIKFETKWTNEIHFFNLILPFNPAYIRLDSTKFSGCLWIPVNNVKIMERLYPLCMSGLQKLFEYMKWV